MYLLMLLATFLSAIYGYNLSVRPDYDRDIPRKKALAVIYKFLYQHNTMVILLSSQVPSAAWCQPGDLFYGSDDFIAKYKSGGSTPLEFPLRRVDREGHSLGPTARNVIQTGRSLYSGEQMVSKVLCPVDELHEATVECTSTADPGNPSGVIDSCCSRQTKYLVSYSKLDARWRNRMTGLVNMEFLWAIAQKEFKTNLGVITWKNSGADRGWHFLGRTKLEAAYHDDKVAYMHEEAERTGKPLSSIEYPAVLQLRTNWKLPSIFGENYFLNANGVEICKASGCLFRIQEM